MLLRNRTVGLVVVVALTTTSMASAADEKSFDAADLVGTWTYASGQRDGADLDADHFAGQTVVITKDSFTLEGDETFVMTYELDTSSSPASVKLLIAEGPVGVGAPAEGILELSDGELKLCYAPMGGDAPEKFEAPAGSGLHLFVLVKDQLEVADLVGTWNYESGRRDGADLDADHFAGQSIVITEETITLAGDETFVISYDLDSSSSPDSLSLEITEGPVGVGAPAEGIVQLKDGELKLCYAPMGGGAPESFEAPAGSGHHLFVLKKAAPAFDAAKLIGTWNYASGQRDGADLDADHFAGQTIVITKETLTLTGNDTFVMTYEFDMSKTPVGVTFTITESPFGAGATAAGVIRLEDGELTLCYSPMGGAGPTKFEAPADSGHHLFVLKQAEQ